MNKNEALKIAVQDITFVMRDFIERYGENQSENVVKLIVLKTDAIRVLMGLLDEESVDDSGL
jgi:hypothetical protein